ncbi:MAG: conjugal transfer protein TrbH [Pseudorhizobium sp.]
MRQLPFAFLIMMAITGCQTNGDAAPTASSVELSGPPAGAIAGDMASRLAEQVDPSRLPAIKMNEHQTEYAIALKAALQGWGYRFSADEKTEPDPASVDLHYSLDRMDEQILAQLTMPSISIARAYVANANGATPASPLSIIQRK